MSSTGIIAPVFTIFGGCIPPKLWTGVWELEGAFIQVFFFFRYIDHIWCEFAQYKHYSRKTAIFNDMILKPIFDIRLKATLLCQFHCLYHSHRFLFLLRDHHVWGENTHWIKAAGANSLQRMLSPKFALSSHIYACGWTSSMWAWTCINSVNSYRSKKKDALGTDNILDISTKLYHCIHCPHCLQATSLA